MSLPVTPEPSAPAENVSIHEYVTEYLGVLRRRWVVFASVALLVFAAGLVVLVMRKPVYESTATLSVPPDTTTADPGDPNPIPTMVASTMPVGFDAQLQLLESSA